MVFHSYYFKETCNQFCVKAAFEAGFNNFRHKFVIFIWTNSVFMISIVHIVYSICTESDCLQFSYLFRITFSIYSWDLVGHQLDYLFVFFFCIRRLQIHEAINYFA